MRTALLVGTLFVLAGCDNRQVENLRQEEPPPDLFAQGEFLCREMRWGQAREVLREFLLDNPDHAGAHFYLGRSYLFWEKDFRPAIAVGELQTALALYRDSGEHHIERFPDEYFELICDIESAKVCIKQAILLQNLGFPRQTAVAVLDRGWEYTQRARKSIPDHPDIASSEEAHRNFYDALGVKSPDARGA